MRHRLEKLSFQLKDRRLFWSKNVRVFTDGVNPSWTWIPRISRHAYADHWGMFGFMIQIFGRQVFFSFGEDRNGLYADNGSTTAKAVEGFMDGL